MHRIFQGKDVPGCLAILTTALAGMEDRGTVQPAARTLFRDADSGNTLIVVIDLVAPDRIEERVPLSRTIFTRV